MENNDDNQIKYFDDNINRKAKIYLESLNVLKKNIPLPAIIDISNSGACNRACSFCPRSDPNYKHVYEFLPNSLHDDFCKELGSYGFKGIFSYSGFGEPMLKKDIYRDIVVARKFMPKSKIEIITNGDVLNKEKLLRLFESGLTTILISVYDGKKEEEGFYNLCESINLKREQYVIRNRYLPENLDFGITISNRAGNLKNAKHIIPATKEPLKKNCNYPSYYFFLDFNGDVLMCSHDWSKEKIVGNLKKNSFYDIWTSKIYHEARKSLYNSNRCFSPCNQCDVKGDLLGKEYVDVWKNSKI